MRKLISKLNTALIFAAFLLLLSHAAYGQTATLALSSGSAGSNGTVTLNLTLSSGTAPAGVQWTFTYAPSQITALSATAGTALTAAGKTLDCVAGSGSYTCLATGLNANAIANGSVATVNVTIASGVSGASIAVSNAYAASTQGVTVAVTASGGTVTGPQIVSGLSVLSCNPTTIATPSSTTCSVSLSGAAPSGGAVVTLSDNSSSVSIPASVTVPAGSTGASFTATAAAVTSAQTATITASYSGVSRSASLSLTSVVSVSSLQCSPTTLASAATSSCTVALTGAAPSSGATVTLSSSSSALTIPGSISVGGGSTTASFTARAGTVNTNTTAIVTAALNGVSRQVSISLTAPATLSLSSLACGAVNSARASTCTVALTGAAPSGGAVVTLADNSASVSVPSSVTVSAGSTTASFTATFASSSSASQTVVITATYNGVSRTASLTQGSTVLVSSLVCDPSSPVSGTSGDCEITLNQAAPSGGAVVALSSSSSVLSGPASVTIPAGSTSALAIYTTGSVTSNQTVIVTASLNGSSKQTTVTVTASATITVSSLVCNPATVNAGGSSVCTVTLSRAATSGGVVVAISDNNASLAVPASVAVQASGMTVTFSVTAGSVTSNVAVAVTASLSGASKTAALTVVAPTSTRYSIFSSSAVPSNVSEKDTAQVELGMKFRSSTAGYVTGVRFYKGPQNTGTHIGHLWSKSGALLASVTFANESASGWQQANFASPVAIAANTTYVVSYRCPNGWYSDDLNYFSSNSPGNGPVRALRDGEDGANGVYRYGSNVFPRYAYRASNYWVDVVFAGGTTPPATTTNSISQSVDPKSTGERAASTDEGPALSCSPRSVPAGGSFTCEMRLNEGEEAQLDVDGSNSVTLPATVAARANQRTLTFRGSVNDGAPQESFTISATVAGERVEEVLAVEPAATLALSAPGSQLAKWGTPIHFKVSADAAAPVELSAADLPAGAVFDAATGSFEWTPLEEQQGAYDVKFAALAAGASAEKVVHLEVDSGVPVINTSSPLACASGAVGTLNGRWLAEDVVSDPTGGSLDMAGTRLMVNGAYVPVLYADRTSVRFLCPEASAGEALDLALETPFGKADALRATVRDADPVLLSAADDSQGIVLLSGSASLAAVRDVRSAGAPAQPGDSISLRATGIGRDLPLFVKIGDVYAEVESIAPAPDAAGIWEIQVKAPSAASFGDAVPVELELVSPSGELLTSNKVTIALEPVRE